MNNPKSLQGKINDFIKTGILGLELEGFQIISVALCFMIFSGGFWLGIINLDSSSYSEKLKIFISIIQLAIIGMFSFLIHTYVKGNIDKAKEDYRKKKLELEEIYESDKIKLKREINDNYKKEQELEFLSILFEQCNDDFPDNFNFYDVFCETIKSLRGKKGALEKAVNNHINELNGRKEAVKDLENGFSRGQDGIIPLSRLIGEACNYALDIKSEEADESVRYFYLDIQAYFKAWLVCSIKYGVDIPIEPFFQESLEVDGKSHSSKEAYIKAIEYIKKLVALPSKEILYVFKESNSREIVDTYLGKLIVLLNHENTSNKTPESNKAH